MLFSKYHLNSIEDIKTEEYRTKLYHLLGPQRVAGPKGNTGAQVTALLFLWSIKAVTSNKRFG